MKNKKNKLSFKYLSVAIIRSNGRVDEEINEMTQLKCHYVNESAIIVTVLKHNINKRREAALLV